MEIHKNISDFLNGDPHYEAFALAVGAPPLTVHHMAFCSRADRNLRRYLNGNNYGMLALLGELETLIYYHPPTARELITIVLDKLERAIIDRELYELMDGMFGLNEGRAIIDQKLNLYTKRS